jgi:hypothetical protein
MKNGPPSGRAAPRFRTTAGPAVVVEWDLRI